MKIYTKGGDKGSTSLWGGKRVSKASLRIETYGTIDELNVHIGLIRDSIDDDMNIAILEQIQNQLFTFGSHLAADPEKNDIKLPIIHPDKVVILEEAIDSMEQELPALTSFILPGGHQNVSFCHLGRVVCRRAERLVIALNQEREVNPNIIVYLNRLSDFLFVLSREIAHKLGAKELPWKPEN
ncbi:MAG: cob(I)yrinic acid a,c-diamide adenosyltransferase [Bacteroidetes bacterium]|nr:MAG: cob(I)yrinic acid a,c-diamide adenosyltransferase [Bacteroidota bacterium]